MISPQVDFTAELAEFAEPSERKLALRIKRRKTVSVTPAMGARIVAGAMRTLPIWTDAGTAASLSDARSGAGVSQYFRTSKFYRCFCLRACLHEQYVDHLAR